MAHFAKLDSNDTVIAVHCVHNNELLVDGVENEARGIEFLKNLHGHANWKQTSYNGTIRKNYAGIGYQYDPSLDAFIPPQPFASWLLNENTCQWQAPVPMPADRKAYAWDEAAVNWIELQI